MSDETDSSAPTLPADLSDHLQETNRRLQAAHADYLEASAESQRALTTMLETVSELSETIQKLHAGGDGIESQKPTAEIEERPSTPRKSRRSKPVEIFEGDEHPIQEEENTTQRKSPASEADQADQSQNTLPARLHSRGIVIPDPPGALDESQAPIPKQTTASPIPRPSNSPGVERPVLTEAAVSEPHPFSGLDKEHRIILTNDGFGVAPVLNEILSSQGFRVRIDSRRPEMSAPADTVIFLAGLRAPSNLDDAMSIVDDAVYTADRMTTRLMQPGSAFVAAIDTGGGFGLDTFDPVAAPLGALLGLVRLLDRRHPGAHTKLIDFDGGKLSAPQIGERLATELLEGGDTTPVALSLEQRRTVQWEAFDHRTSPASWLEDEAPPLVYMPGPDAVLSTAVERLAIAHELPVAVLRRRHTPGRLANDFSKMGIDTRSTNYDLNRLFAVMDFLDNLRSDYGPIAAIIAESMAVRDPDDLAAWEAMRSPLDEFNALLAMTINDPLRLLGVGIGPNTPPVVASALRYFARAESLRRNDRLQVRLAHLQRSSQRNGEGLDPCDFAITEFLAGSSPESTEVRFGT